MAARGSISKDCFYKKLLETFDGSFMYNDGKEIRIPFVEDGNPIQLKVSVTCAKENVSIGDDNKLPGAAVETEATPSEPSALSMSEEETKNLQDFMQALGF